MKMPVSSALPLYAWVALFFFVLAESLLFAGVKIAGDFFYLLVWWPYIFFSDGIIKARTGRSPLLSNIRAFCYMLPWSVTIWLVFEVFNFRLSNWHYIHLVSPTAVRWAGYALSFATVLPGIFVTSELLRSFNLLNRNYSWGFRITPKMLAAAQVLGGLMLVLPVLYPLYFFPLVWGGFVLLLDPVNLRMGAPSLLKDLSQGRPARILRLLAAGLICGFLWEFWNFWATAKWIYTVPFVGDIKLFEMPVLGFLGFPPFSLECFVMYVFINVMGGAPAAGFHDMALQNTGRKPAGLTAVLIFNGLFWLPVFYLMDRFTVLSFSQLF